MKEKVLERVRELKKNGLYPFFRSISESEGTVVKVGQKDCIMIGSNNYLGLTHHPYVKEAAIKAIEKYGTGCTGSRFLNGNLKAHEQLEEKIADYVGHEKALLFSTGMQSNLGAISAICGARDLILSDAENHASIIDGCKLSPATIMKYKHNNMEELERLLEENINRFKNTMIITDGVFSMSGELVDLPSVVKLAKKYGAKLYLDDAHGLGVMGFQGRGTMTHFNLADSVDFNMGTFSKSFASIGGFVSGKSDDMDYIRHTARSFIFSASMPPSAIATVSACIDLAQKDSRLHDQLWDNVAFMRKGYNEIGLRIYDSNTPIISIFIGDELLALKAASYLQEKGIFATSVLPPAVPQGEALIRTSFMASHTKGELTKVLEVFADLKKNFPIPVVKDSLIA